VHVTDLGVKAHVRTDTPTHNGTGPGQKSCIGQPCPWASSRHRVNVSKRLHSGKSLWQRKGRGAAVLPLASPVATAHLGPAQAHTSAQRRAPQFRRLRWPLHRAVQTSESLGSSAPVLPPVHLVRRVHLAHQKAACVLAHRQSIRPSALATMPPLLLPLLLMPPLLLPLPPQRLPRSPLLPLPLPPPALLPLPPLPLLLPQASSPLNAASESHDRPAGRHAVADVLRSSKRPHVAVVATDIAPMPLECEAQHPWRHPEKRCLLKVRCDYSRLRPPVLHTFGP
jgi:hypothetical protein